MKQAACIDTARHVLSEVFGVEATECDHVLSTWSRQTHTSLPQIADVLVHQIWQGDATCEDRALVRYLEHRLRQLPADRARYRRPAAPA